MNRNLVSAVAAIGLLTAAPGRAEPIGILDLDGGYVDLLSTHIMTGARIIPYIGSTLQTGVPIGAPDEVFENKEYTAMQVQLGNADEEHESYLERMGSSFGVSFASSTANGAADMDVGAVAFAAGSHALSRFNLTIKNHRSRPINFDFAFDIPEGELVTIDPALYPAFDPRRSHARVEANIDVLLKSPDEENEGTWIESEMNLFNFYGDLLGAGQRNCRPENIGTCIGKVLEYSPNMTSLFHEKPIAPGHSVFGFDIDPYSGLISLPEIPPFGELTVYYDLFALGFGYLEGGARAMLGDPFGIAENGGVRLIERLPNAGPGEPTQVSEPSTLALAGLGMLVGACGMRRRKQVRLN